MRITLTLAVVLSTLIAHGALVTRLQIELTVQGRVPTRPIDGRVDIVPIQLLQPNPAITKVTLPAMATPRSVQFMDNLPAGTWRVEVHAPKYLSQPQIVTIGDEVAKVRMVLVPRRKSQRH